MNTKVWPVAEALTQHLGLLLGRKVHPEDFKEKLASFRHEEVRAAVPVLSMIRRSSLNLTGHILIVGCEGIAEL